MRRKKKGTVKLLFVHCPNYETKVVLKRQGGKWSLKKGGPRSRVPSRGNMKGGPRSRVPSRGNRKGGPRSRVPSRGNRKGEGIA